MKRHFARKKYRRYTMRFFSVLVASIFHSNFPLIWSMDPCCSVFCELSIDPYRNGHECRRGIPNNVLIGGQ